MTATALTQPNPLQLRRRFLSSLTICGIWSMAVAYLMMLISFTIEFHAGPNSSMYMWYLVTCLTGLAAYFSPPGLVERKASKILFVLVLAGIMALVGFITFLIISFMFSKSLFIDWQNKGGMTAFGFYLATGITLTLFGALSGVGRAVLISMERRALVMGATTSAIGWALGSVFIVLWLQANIRGAGRFEMYFNEHATSYGLLLFLSTYALPWLLLENDIKKFPLKYLPREERIRERGRIATVSDRVQLFGIERFNKPKQAPDFPSLKEPDRNEGRVWWKLRATATEDGRAVLLIALNGYMNPSTAPDFWKMLGNCIESGWDMLIVDISCVKEWADVDMTFTWQAEADRRDARVLLSRPDRLIQDAVVNSNLPHNFGLVRKGQGAFDYFNRDREGKIPVEVIASESGKPRLTVESISSRAAPNAPLPDLPSPQVHAFRYFQWKAEPFRTVDHRPAAIVYIRGKLRRHTGYEVNELLDLFGRAGWRLIVLNLAEAEEQAIVGVIHSFTDHLYDRGGVLVLVGAMGPLLIPRDSRDAVSVSYASDNLRAQQLLNDLCQSVAPPPKPAPVTATAPIAAASGLQPTPLDIDGASVRIAIADPAMFTDVFRPGGPFPAIQQMTRELGPNVSITLRAERTPAQLPLAAIYIKGELIAAYNYEITSQVKRMARSGWKAFNLIFKQRPSVQVQHNFFNLRRELERANVALVLTCTAEVKMQLDERLTRALPVNVSRTLSGQEIDRTFGISYQPAGPTADLKAPAEPAITSTAAVSPVTAVSETEVVVDGLTRLPAAVAANLNVPDEPAAAPAIAAAMAVPALESHAHPVAADAAVAKPVESGIAPAAISSVTPVAPAIAMAETAEPAVPPTPVVQEPVLTSVPAPAPTVESEPRPVAAVVSANPVDLDAPVLDAPEPDLPAVPEAPSAHQPLAAAAAPRFTSGLSPHPPRVHVTKSGQQVPLTRPNRSDNLPVHDHKGSQFQLRAERQSGGKGDIVVLQVGGSISRERGDSIFHLRTAFEALVAEHLGRVVLDCTELKTLHEGLWLAEQRAAFRAVGPGCDLVVCNLPHRLRVVCGMAKWDEKLLLVDSLAEAKRLLS